jgi:hypothetical protein
MNGSVGGGRRDEEGGPEPCWWFTAMRASAVPIARISWNPIQQATVLDVYVLEYPGFCGSCGESLRSRR